MQPIRTVALVDTKISNPNYYIVLAIFEALKRREDLTRVDLLSYDDINEKVREWRYDLLLAVDGEHLNAPVFAQATKHVRRSALWVWEDPYERQINLINAALFDIVFTNDLGSVKTYGGRATFMPLAANSILPIATQQSDYKNDIFFAGSAWPNRVQFLRQLCRELPTIKKKIVLQYNPGVPSAPLDLPESDYAGRIAHKEFLETANQSKVTLTLHRAFSGDGRNRAATSPGPRIFEAALAGGCQLVEQSGVEIDSFFKRGAEVETFANFTEFKLTLLRLLHDNDLRNELAKRSQDRAIRDHTYDVRISEIIRTVALLPMNTSTVSISPDHKTKPSVLFVTHNSVGNGHFGGVEVYQDTIASELIDDYDIKFFLPAKSQVYDGLREYILTDKTYRVIRSFLVPDFDLWHTLSHPPLEEVFGRILAEENIDLVHFHHLINHCPSLPKICKMMGVRSVYTFQDFWTVCKKFNLIDHTGRYCNIASRPIAACDICLNATDGLNGGAQILRREFFSEVLHSIDKIIFNTPQSISVFEGVYPDVSTGRKFILGLPTPRTKARAVIEKSNVKKDTANPASPLRVVFLGNFTNAKGADVFLEAAYALRHDNVKFTVCGRLSDSDADKVRSRGLPNIELEGGFAPGELDLSRFDVALILSIWPETYCITLSEAWQAGLVPIASDCGALSDRVTHDVDGFKVAPGDSAAVTYYLRVLMETRELVRLRNNIGSHLWLTPAQHADQLKLSYSELVGMQASGEQGVQRYKAGSGPSLALSRLASYPASWTSHPPELKIPLLGRDLHLISPLWRHTQAANTLLHEGKARYGTLGWALDELPGWRYHLAEWRDRSKKFESTNRCLEITGWCGSSEGDLSAIALGLRSLNRDLLLLPISVMVRHDVVSQRRHPALGFKCKLTTLAALGPGIYSLEIYSNIFGDTLDVTPLPIAIAVTEDGIEEIILADSLFSDGPDSFPVSPLLKMDTGFLAPLMGTAAYFLEKLSICGGTPLHQNNFLSLSIAGWLVASDRDYTSAISLTFTGAATGAVALKKIPRPDVVLSVDPEADLHNGFAGEFWLTDMPDGDYQLYITYEASSGAAGVEVGSLHIKDGEAFTSAT